MEASESVRTQRRRLAQYKTLAAAVSLTACLSGPQVSEITELRNAAVGFALTERAFVVALVRQCRFDPDTRANLMEPAKAAMDAWFARNQATLDAANLYFEDYLVVFARRSGRRAAADRRAELTRQYASSGSLAAQSTIDEAGGRERCPELLDRLERGDLNLDSSEFDAALDGIVEKYAVPKS